jgi:hypothetical protein
VNEDVLATIHDRHASGRFEAHRVSANLKRKLGPHAKLLDHEFHTDDPGVHPRLPEPLDRLAATDQLHGRCEEPSLRAVDARGALASPAMIAARKATRDAAIDRAAGLEDVVSSTMSTRVPYRVCRSFAGSSWRANTPS